jgi:hypothetical protein
MDARRTLAHLPFAMLLAIAACSPEERQPVQRVPGWSQHLPTPQDQYLFLAEVREYFAEKDMQAELEPDGRLKVVAEGGPTYDLGRLAEICGRLEPEDWRAAIRTHFDALGQLEEESTDAEVPPLAIASPKLRLKLYPEEFLRDPGVVEDEVLFRRDLEGTVTCVVMDREESVLVVPRRALTDWRLPEAQVFALARSNTVEALADDIEDQAREFEGLGRVHVLTGKSFYAASAVLWLQEYAGLAGRHGAIVTVPWRHGAFVYPFDDERVMRVVPGLRRLAEKVVAESAGPLSTAVHWWHPERGFVLIRVVDRDGQLEITPPAELAELLRRLQEK